MLKPISKPLALRIGNRRAVIGVDSIADAVRKFLALQWKAGQRGGIIRFASIHDARTMEQVARISQNGRAWNNGEWVPNAASLYDPTDADFDAARGERRVACEVLS